MLFAASLAGHLDCFNPGRTLCCVAAPPPREVARVWNQGPAIWFPTRDRYAALKKNRAATGLLRIEAEHGQSSRCAAQRDLYERVETRARGDEELSARKGSETEGAGHSRHSKKSKTSDRTARKGDLGRALRTVYDDTLREPVPDDFLKLIGKLS